MEKIMIVEDDGAIRDELSLILYNEGYEVIAITDFNETARQARETKPDLILLDVGLPGRDGFLLCADIRKTLNVPIIFVTSRDGAMDELRALSLGGDDYISKPYNIPVLLARIKAVMRRRSGTPENELMEADGLCLDLARGSVSYEGNITDLSRNELRILAHLLKNKGAIISRADLLEDLWINRIYIDDNTLSVNMTRLRSKLSELGLPDLIKTRRGMGYQI